MGRRVWLQKELRVGVELTPVSVKVLDGFKIWIEFNDGVNGEIDLSRFAEQVWFEPWKDRSVFESVRIIPYEAVVWGDDDETDMGLCVDALYLELTGKSWEENKVPITLIR